MIVAASRQNQPRLRQAAISIRISHTGFSSTTVGGLSEATGASVGIALRDTECTSLTGLEDRTGGTDLYRERGTQPRSCSGWLRNLPLLMNGTEVIYPLDK
jgi:hypothetical protein